MEAEPVLTSRAQEILRAVVRNFIETGEPVGSQTISRLWRNSLSPASIRNVMADLAEQGYLSQPHTSAGRVPTEKAFRYYARSITAPRIPRPELERWRARFRDAASLEDRFELSSQFLSELTRNVGIAAAMPAASQSLDRVELLALADRRVLMILVTGDQMVRNRVVSVREPVAQQELDSIRNYVNRNFSGWELSRARRELVRRIEVDRALFNDALRKLGWFYDKGLLDDGTPEIHLEGTANLVGMDLHLTREKMSDLLHALEQKQRILELLDRFLEESPGGLQVRVGLAEAHPAMRELVLIGLSCTMPAGLLAKVAVLGPMRMHYQRVMSAVLHIGHVLEESPH
jgi:heat-inducible transcriptional repressor